MSQVDKRVDAYIARSAPFAQPILEHLRALIHKACPDVVETIKWGFPHFVYHGILCSMASFKNHCAFSFWKGSIMKDPDGILTIVGKTSMGHFGKLTSLKDIPSEKVLIKYLKHASRLNEDDIKIERSNRVSPALKIPSNFAQRLKKDKKALNVFNNFSISKQQDYIAWITEAKTDLTRSKRIEQSIVWLAEGKSRNWKYDTK